MSGVDTNKYREKLQKERELQAGRTTKFSATLFWKPKVGENRIRILPPWAVTGPNAGFFSRDVSVHWKIGAVPQNYACPAAKLPPDSPHTICPICEYYFSLHKTGNPLDKEKAKDFRAKRQGYINIVDLNDPVYTEQDTTSWRVANQDGGKECPFKVGETKVQAYTPSGGSISEIENYFQDVDMSDLDTGHDFIIDRVGTTKEDTRYKIRIFPTATPFKFIGDMASKLINFDLIMPYLPVDQLREALNSTPSLATASSAPALAVPGRASAALPAATVEDEDDLPPNFGGGHAPVDEEIPICFKDAKVHSKTNPECVGGVVDGEQLDECPLFTECAAAVAAATPPAPIPVKRRVRGAAAATVATPLVSSAPASDIEALEAELRKKLR